MARGVLSVLLLAALAFAYADVRAEQLDAATCGQLKGELVRMEQNGARGNMAKGPEWAKANLPPDKLDQIRRLIELDEQLLFRCSVRNLVELPPDADADPPAPADEAGKEAAPAKAEGPPAKQKKAGPKAAPAQPPAAQPKPKQAVKAEPKTKDAGSAPGKAAAAKPKPKVNDAFKPPAGDPQADPFANQPARQ